jgi:hypothetical protein
MSQQTLLAEMFKFFAYRVSKLGITDMTIAIDQGLIMLKNKVAGWFCTRSSSHIHVSISVTPVIPRVCARIPGKT